MLLDIYDAINIMVELIAVIIEVYVYIDRRHIFNEVVLGSCFE